MKKVKINVTARDIREALKTFGKKNASNFCPVARAAQRVLKDKQAWAGVSTISSKYGSCDLPAAAQAFVQRFDYKKPVKPFSFTINLPAA